MSTDKNQGLRIIKMLELLRSETDDNHVLTRKQIEEKLTECGLVAERRTFYRDIELLRSAGFDIEHNYVGHEYGFYLVEQQFSVAELKLIVDALHAANFLTDKKTDELIDKVANIGGKFKAEDIKASNIHFNTRKHSNEAILTVIEQLTEAIKQHRKITCKVFDLNAKGKPVYRHRKKTYTLEPLALIHNDDNYYLLCYDEERGVYPRRIDRMNSVDISFESISKEALAKLTEAEKYTDGVFRMYGGKKETVTLEFKEEALNCIFDRFGEKTKILPTDREGIYQTTVNIEISPTFWGWFFQFVGEMMIVSPESVAKEYKKRLKTGNKIV